MNEIIRLPLHVEGELMDYSLGAGTCEERARIEAHLERCPRCTRELAEIVDGFTLFAEAEVAGAAPGPSPRSGQSPHPAPSPIKLKNRLLDSIEWPMASNGALR